MSSSTNCSWSWVELPGQARTTITGRFVDEDGDTSASVGESTEYNITITNEGKVRR